ncbi:hypothetical protein J2S43_000299 [Catenuloplanes nepalensis]|uniref:STAS domain-containing protein n=1 Tax=Catenuloplanes nepalensis TaxID=587533 RepID=A0ABT9MK37_9ACTN|nr:hypothetical protein [Catenuloplanes nepalensis]MDP9791787.1 hypothetical protein [Catenuloplanes nepalensis]
MAGRPRAGAAVTAGAVPPAAARVTLAATGRADFDATFPLVTAFLAVAGAVRVVAFAAGAVPAVAGLRAAAGLVAAGRCAALFDVPTADVAGFTAAVLPTGTARFGAAD